MELLSTADAVLGIITNACYLVGLVFGAWIFLKGQVARIKSQKVDRDENPGKQDNKSDASTDRDAAE